MSGSRQLHLGAFMRPASIHTGAWRYPGAFPDANVNFEHLKRFAQTLERAKFDAFFMADHPAVLNMPLDALKHSHTVTSFEPFTLLSALAVVTEHLGLIATGSTTFDAPYHVARRFASLDHLSGGRAGWNIVTTSNPDAALNFGMDDHMEHGERYRRAREFYDVVTGLWDSWADDAFVRDAESGLYFDPDKLHVLNHKGRYLSVRGPLNIARPVQGWPVIVQAGASDSGRDLAAETAEAVFTPPANIAAGREFYADVKGRMQKAGRAREHMKIMPACFVVVGDSIEEARAKRAKLDSLVYYDTPSRRSRSRLGTTPRASIPTSRCPRTFPKPMPARARGSGSWRWPRANSSRCGSWRSGSAAILDLPWWARRRPSRTRWKNGSIPTPATASPSCFRICPGGSTISASAWCRNCSAADSSGANMKARRYAKISACPARRTGSSRPGRRRNKSGAANIRKSGVRLDQAL
jgi:alkanesulfonate monooxygenase